MKLENQPCIIAEIYHLTKLIQRKDNLLSVWVVHLHIIEFQKCELYHMYWLWFKKTIRNVIEKPCVFPDENKDRLLHNLVKKFIIPAPSVVGNLSGIENKICHKNVSKKLLRRDLAYQRCDDGKKLQVDIVLFRITVQCHKMHSFWRPL